MTPTEDNMEYQAIFSILKLTGFLKIYSGDAKAVLG